MRKSVKVMAAAMAAMMALAGCGSKTAETTAADTKAAETTTQAAEESSADALISAGMNMTPAPAVTIPPTQSFLR